MADPDPRRTLVVVPALNEEDCIATVVAEIHATNPEVDVLVVDDGSADRTAERASAAGAQVCRLPFNLGVGGAMRVGFRYALDAGYDVAVQVDGDGQHDPAYVSRLVDALGGHDVVIGARFAGTGDYLVTGPRRWAMVMLAVVMSWVTGQRLTDVTSGYRAANRRAIAVFAAHYPAEYLGDTVESLVIAHRAGCSVTQVPVAMRVRTTGRASQSTARSGIYLTRAVAAVLLALVRRWPTPRALEKIS